MTGPLRRLSRRLAGEGLPRVRAVGQRPYGPMPPLQTEWPPEDTLAPSIHTPSPSPPLATDASPSAGFPTPIQPTSSENPAEMPLVSQTAANGPTRGQTHASGEATSPYPATPTPLQRTAPLASGEPMSMAPIQKPGPSDAQGDTSNPPTPADRERLTVAPHQNPLAPPTHRPSDSNWPHPLMPMQALRESTGQERDGASRVTGPTQSVSANVPPDSLASQRSTAPPNEVHVHIGRSEVTALHQPPAATPARAKPSGNQPLSLDDYLAKRRSKA
jgi:hypothetical protein